MTAVTVAYAAVVEAIATVVPDRPIRGLHVAKVGDWTIALNAARVPALHEGEEMSPWSAKVTSDRYLACAILNPISGMVGGMAEADFITEMQALAAPVSTTGGQA